MLCKELMAYPVVYNLNTDNILSVLNNMANYNINFIPIKDKNLNIVGIITKTDIIKRIILNKIDLLQKINNYMTKEIIFCYEEEDVTYAISKMANYQIKQILIFNNHNNLTGTISIKEIALNEETNKYLNDLLYEIYQNLCINPIKYIKTEKKI